MPLQLLRLPQSRPSSGLAALSDLAVQVTDLKELATNALGPNPRLYNRLKTFLKPTQLPYEIDQFVVNVRTLAMRSVKEKLFMQSDGEPIDQRRIDITYETVSMDLLPIIA